MKSSAGAAGRVQYLKLGTDVNVEDALAKYRQSPAVEYAEPNYLHYVTAIPNDGDCTQFEYDALRKANTAGVMFLAAAGNFGTDNDSISFFPSGYIVATPCDLRCRM